MNHQIVPLPAGLYVVATPIGTARDITLRALDILASADVLVAEDTRSLKRLMQIHGVPLGTRPVRSYHDHSGPADRARIAADIEAGLSVAYASEAGTPMVSDPGYHLVQDLVSAGALVTSAPGPSAVLAALTLAALPTDHFLFLGFLPPKAGARRTLMEKVAQTPATLVVYESPKRVHELLAELEDVLGADRSVALCRELTKRFEEVLRGTLATVRAQLSERALKGECVLVLGPPVARDFEESDLMEILRDELTRSTVRDAAAAVATRFDLPRKQAYQLALRIEREIKT